MILDDQCLVFIAWAPLTLRLFEAKRSDIVALTKAGQQQPLHIVTGAGTHSARGNPVLLPSVTRWLDREGWSWRYDTPPTQSRVAGVVVTGLQHHS